ncbi:MAG TPA: tetratricopeptide repeat protein [Thermoanaerobaculia bacterium]|nr:tetratricopeptide repeat protein [Thermoanaerobaculia bacterium]
MQVKLLRSLGITAGEGPMHLDATAIKALASMPRGALAHLLSCARCRRRLAVVALEDPSSGGPEPSSAPGWAETILMRAVALDLEESRREGQAAPAELELYDDLIDVEPELRVQTIAERARFRSLGLARLLVAAADGASREDPRRSRHLAGLAAAALDRLADSQVRRRLEADATVLLAEAERRLGRFEVAEDLLKQTVVALGEESLLHPERIGLCRALAALRREQERLDEALALFDRAAALAEELGVLSEHARARLATGWLLVDDLEPEEALVPLLEAKSYFASVAATRELLSTLDALALAYAELGWKEHLDEVERALDGLVSQGADPVDAVRVRWIKARERYRRSPTGSTLSVLWEAFERLVAEGQGIEAARAGLELARLLVEEGPDAALAERLAAIAGRLAALSGDRLAAHLVPPLRFALELAARREGSFMEPLLRAIDYLKRGRFNPGVPFHPTADPHLRLRWHELAIGQRRQAAAAAGVELGRSGEPRNALDLRRISWTHEALTGVRIELPEGFAEDDETPRA